MSCKEIGYELDRNSRLNAPSALEHKNGSTLCFIGMFTTMAELMCKEMHKIDDLVKRGFVSTAFLHRITVAQFDDFGIGKNNSDVRQCAASVEQIFNFWSKSKDKMTADRIDNHNIITNDDVEIIYPIQNQHLKQQLLGLNHQNLCNFVAKKIMMENPSEERQNEKNVTDMEMDD
ncbi:hypothetical protein niasHT_013814 [Heterodera trifolii]|uniref:Uncharacterized protein n=1 Tax=Heterodera trifolii TaxID=157864 RepID=A0ABD2KTV1_9BILA